MISGGKWTRRGEGAVLADEGKERKRRGDT
jgi:hypothetical protein